MNVKICKQWLNKMTKLNVAKNATCVKDWVFKLQQLTSKGKAST